MASSPQMSEGVTAVDTSEMHRRRERLKNEQLQREPRVRLDSLVQAEVKARKRKRREGVETAAARSFFTEVHLRKSRCNSLRSPQARKNQDGG